MGTRGIAAAALAALGLSCGSAPQGAVTSCAVTSLVPVPVKTDILFVVDDSGSMSEEQANLAANLDAFVATLAASPAKDQFQIGVTTTSVAGTSATDFSATETTYASGPNAAAPVVPYPAGRLVAVDPATGRLRWDPATGAFTGNRILAAGSPTLVADFKANVRVGTGGSGKEQGLAAIRLALTDRIVDGTNAGFLRPGARLAVVILSDEDDCTETNSPYALTTNDLCHDPTRKAGGTNGAEPVSDFVALLQGPIAGERREIAAAGIIAVDPVTRARDTQCATAFDKVSRYFDFVEAFGQSALVDSICNASFRQTLEQIAGVIAPQFVELSQVPADPALLTVALHRADGTTQPCQLGTDPGGTFDAIYSEPEGHPPRITFQRNCVLHQGDAVDLQLLCAR
ncbi:MAG TPA: vWA domain-containing protein [Anaeromyxobacteraceae bacterium]|nr:vWA domain-containing protein [Anaeromyxobacteraceae bacterium]